MKYAVIIRGPLGIGKSTIAKALAKKLSANYISMDKILEDNGLDKVEGEGIPTMNFIKADEIVLPKVRKELEKKVVVFDGCFYHKEQLEHLEREIPQTYVFDLKASIETCIKRDKGRKRVYGEGAARAVYEMVGRFDYGTNFDTEGKTAAAVVKEILSYLKKK